MSGLLNSSSGYVFEVPPSGVRVDGGIMPARDVANDGSWKVLRGEDVCFMVEAAKRRIALQRFSSSPWPAFSNVPREYDEPLLHRALAGAGARVTPASGEIPLRRRYLASAWSDFVLPSYSYTSILLRRASATHEFSGSMPEGRWKLVYEGASSDGVGSLDWTDEGVAKRMVGLAGATNPGSRASAATSIPDQAGVLRADDIRLAFWWMKGAGPLVVAADVAEGYDYGLTASQLAERDAFKWHVSSSGACTRSTVKYKYVPNGQSGGFPAAYSRYEWTETGSVTVPDGVLSPTAAWRNAGNDSTYTRWWEQWSHLANGHYYSSDEGVIHDLRQPSYGPVLSGLDSAHGGLPSAFAGTRCAYMLYVVFAETWSHRFPADTEKTPLPSPATTSYFFRAVCPGEVSSSGNVVFDSPVDMSEVIAAVRADERVDQRFEDNPVPGPSSYLDGLTFTREIHAYPFFGYLVFYDEPTDLARHIPGWTWSPGTTEGS